MMAKKPVPVKKSEMIDGETIKYHANGKTRWSKGKIVDGKTEGYWEWYRIDGTIKRSGYFHLGEPVGEWTTYDEKGDVYKVVTKKAADTSIDGIGKSCPAELSEKDDATRQT